MMLGVTRAFPSHCFAESMTKLSAQSTDFHAWRLLTARFLCLHEHHYMCKYSERLKRGTLDAHAPNTSSMLMVNGVCFESLAHSIVLETELNTENEAYWVISSSFTRVFFVVA